MLDAKANQPMIFSKIGRCGNEYTNDFYKVHPSYHDVNNDECNMVAIQDHYNGHIELGESRPLIHARPARGVYFEKLLQFLLASGFGLGMQ